MSKEEEEEEEEGVYPIHRWYHNDKNSDWQTKENNMTSTAIRPAQYEWQVDNNNNNNNSNNHETRRDETRRKKKSIDDEVVVVVIVIVAVIEGGGWTSATNIRHTPSSINTSIIICDVVKEQHEWRYRSVAVAHNPIYWGRKEKNDSMRCSRYNKQYRMISYCQENEK